ncbi:HupE/UreJ family protein [Roseicella sp. DB1501]|uniref:HupE/UreJ family protein n=1 Tax=Roseicella sp. DB1501 TaxID=2730925 RepID=UPI001491DC8D|nr:HupE/UreJ family protein [Roseicella sp. DB1501]NOG69894.1 urease accessory protein UreJ [Roseicella sp. DB1501]
MTGGRIIQGAAWLAAAAALPRPALAHHAMGGAAPATLWQGVASGLAHPVIGLDHLAFLLAIGLLAAAAPARGLRALGLVLAGGLAGAALHLAGIGLGPVEALVALSVLLAGALLLAPAPRPAALLGLAAALAGLVHGHAYAEAVAGAGPVPVLGYLASLTVMQAALVLGAMAAARWFGAARSVQPRRLAGLAVAGIGAVALGAALLA